MGYFFYPLLDGEKSSNKKQIKILRKISFKKKKIFSAYLRKLRLGKLTSGPVRKIRSILKENLDNYLSFGICGISEH